MVDKFSSAYALFSAKKWIGLNDQNWIVNGLLHVCSIMNHKWIDLVLANYFQVD